MKKYKVVIFVLLTILILYLCGCSLKKDREEFVETALICVESDEDLLLELFDKLNYYEIYSIELYDSHDEKTYTDFVIDFNDREFLIDMHDEEEVVSSIEDYLPICSVMDELLNKYPKVDKIYNFTPYYGYLEISFAENYFTIDWSIDYYPPGSDLPENRGDDDAYHEIKNGFYIHYFYPGG